MNSLHVSPERSPCKNYLTIIFLIRQPRGVKPGKVAHLSACGMVFSIGWEQVHEGCNKQCDGLWNRYAAVAVFLDGGAVRASVFREACNAFAAAPDRVEVTLEILWPSPANEPTGLIDMIPIGGGGSWLVRFVGHEGSLRSK